MTVNVLLLLDPDIETVGAVMPDKDPYEDVEFGAYWFTDADHAQDWLETEYSLLGFATLRVPLNVAVP